MMGHSITTPIDRKAQANAHLQNAHSDDGGGRACHGRHSGRYRRRLGGNDGLNGLDGLDVNELDIDAGSGQNLQIGIDDETPVPQHGVEFERQPLHRIGLELGLQLFRLRHGRHPPVIGAAR